jgi:hypothetical protein
MTQLAAFYYYRFNFKRLGFKKTDGFRLTERRDAFSEGLSLSGGLLPPVVPLRINYFTTPGTL